MNELLVIKVGTSSLVDDYGRLDDSNFHNLASQIIDLRKTGTDVVLVSSGAVAAGASELSMTRQQMNNDPDKLSALAAVGQVPLVNKWAGYLSPVVVAQNLITPLELTDAREGDAYIRKLHQTLLFDALPVVNENDAVADEEIKVGDNDRLSSLLAVKLHLLGEWTVRLVMLTDVDGLYTRAPHHDDARLIHRVVDSQILDECLDDGVGSRHGTGGAGTKKEAVNIANSAGVPVYLGNGRERGVIKRLLQNQTGTGFFTQNARHLVE